MWSLAAREVSDLGYKFMAVVCEWVSTPRSVSS
jgi:hypothetical protein